ncbi:aminoglycoside phosphotransferase family protein [Microbacterium sp. KUDC0406]|uniref:aminoglycoside phosphotransferase family protein n=1 Tax=Microbacterium sp. KUDC0406 TaxID=2909588 RepID=UPI001F22280D|nr:aminoglycoside phosphotransferase family protein [Microbacterium sp. KUDC0406]UJP11217.1 aminoglycoside phosphotransferase family protein [Microbacterium sp. KUDC0406]
MANSPAAERILGEDDVRALLRAEAPHLAALPLTLVADGWDNAIWRLGDDLAVRIPRRELAAPLIAHEQRALPEIGPRLAGVGVSTPVPVVAGRPTATFPWPWSVIPWIDATPALGVARSANTTWAPALASALATMHVPAPPDAPHNPVRGGPLISRDAPMQERLALLHASRPLRAAWEDGLRSARSDERVWIHGDLHPGNILLRNSGLAALIDFGDVTAGDPAYDLAAGWLLFDSQGRHRFRMATGSRYDEPTWVRARAWAAYLALVFLTLSDDRPDHRALGVSTVTELAGG